MTFQERLKQLRKEHGMTQVQLAEKLGVASGTVAMWETGKRSPNFEMIDPSLSQVEDDLTEYALKYARLDEFGRRAVEAIIRVEYERCRSDGALSPAGAYSGSIRISRIVSEE